MRKLIAILGQDQHLRPTLTALMCLVLKLSWGNGGRVSWGTIVRSILVDARVLVLALRWGRRWNLGEDIVLLIPFAFLCFGCWLRCFHVDQSMIKETRQLNTQWTKKRNSRKETRSLGPRGSSWGSQKQLLFFFFDHIIGFTINALPSLGWQLVWSLNELATRAALPVCMTV